MQDYPTYQYLNGYELDGVSSSYEPMPTVVVSSAAVSQWPTQPPLNGLGPIEPVIHDQRSGSVVDCLVTVGLIMLVLLSSSVLLGFTADRLTQGLIKLMAHQSQPEVVIR